MKQQTNETTGAQGCEPFKDLWINEVLMKASGWGDEEEAG